MIFGKLLTAQDCFFFLGFNNSLSKTNVFELFFDSTLLLPSLKSVKI